MDYPTGTQPFGLAAADFFGGDGVTDIVATAYRDAGIVSHKGNSDGTLQTGISQQVCQSPFAIDSGDFDGNGNLDVVVTCVGPSYGTAVLVR